MPNLEAESEKTTLVEEGSELKGTLTSTCPVIVRGKVEGDVSSPSLRVTSSGAVRGHVKVGRLVSQGELSGEIDADSVELSGVVKDQTVVRAHSLSVKLASERGKMELVFGECVLEVGEAPTKEAAIARATDASPAQVQAQPLSEDPRPQEPAAQPASTASEVSGAIEISRASEVPGGSEVPGASEPAVMHATGVEAVSAMAQQKRGGRT